MQYVYSPLSSDSAHHPKLYHLVIAFAVRSLIKKNYPFCLMDHYEKPALTPAPNTNTPSHHPLKQIIQHCSQHRQGTTGLPRRNSRNCKAPKLTRAALQDYKGIIKSPVTGGAEVNPGLLIWLQSVRMEFQETYWWQDLWGQGLACIMRTK